METAKQLMTRNVAEGLASLVIGLLLTLGTTVLDLGLDLLNGFPIFIHLAVIVIITLIGFTLGKKSKTTIGKIGVVLVILGTIINLLYFFGVYILSDLSW